MSSSIFSKLANSQRHQDFLEKLDLQENTIDPGKKASSAGSMASIGLGFQVRCPGLVAGITGERLADLVGGDTALKDIRFLCLKTGAFAEVLPVSKKEVEKLPDAETLFAITLKEGQKQGVAANETKPETTAAAPAGRKRGRPKKTDRTAPAKPAGKTAETEKTSEIAVKRKRGRPRKTEVRPETPASGKARKEPAAKKEKVLGKTKQKKTAGKKAVSKSAPGAAAKRKPGRPKKTAKS